ncbi:MAG: PorT family protein [Bacteroidales bacterium]|nr:PorT family protein [Bacteroidales bacterium]
MITFAALNRFRKILPVILLVMISTQISTAQNLKYGVYLAPSITWFSSDITEVDNQGSRPGMVYVINAEKPLNNNFFLTAGLSIVNAGGRLVGRDAAPFKFQNYTAIVAAGEPVIYRIHYLSVPAGFKARTNQIGSIFVFGDIGIDPKVVVLGKVDVPSLDVEKENGMAEINRFNFGWHLHAGIEYPLGDRTSAALGLGFENNFADITKDVGTQVNDRIAHKILKFIFGINF